MTEVDKIVRLLRDPSVEKRIAAAIVLGELHVKKPEAVEGFVTLIDSGVPVLQRHALEALTQVGSAKKIINKALDLLGSNVDDVRRAAAAALRSVGDDVVPLIRERLAASEGHERRSLDAILAEVGGKDAFSTLLSGLMTASDEQSAKAAALAVRQHVKEAGARERRSYLTETEKYLKKAKDAGPAAICSGIKILGYLEDESALPTLLSYVSAKNPVALRQEALIALRFAAAGKANAKVLGALIEAAESSDQNGGRSLAHTALHTLGTLAIPASAIPRFEKLLFHEDPERVRFAATFLGAHNAATKSLVKALLQPDKARAGIVAETLMNVGSDKAANPIASAMVSSKDPDRAWLLGKVLLPIAKSISTNLRKEILAVAEKKLYAGERGWEAPLEVAQAADGEAVGKALRALAERTRKKDEARAATIFVLLMRTPVATDDDRYALASLELRRSALDTRAQTRAADGALSRLRYLVTRGYDVAGALRKDRALELDHLYYVGFHFTEEGHSLGDDLLEHIIKKSGKTKLAKAAKNKLSLNATRAT
jgi:HEAT repeats